MKAFLIRDSPHGLGAFAARHIVAGEVILEIPRGKFSLITYQELLKKRITDNPLQVSPRRYLDWNGKYIRFNHSCSPNTGLTSYPNLAYVALREIRSGEELRFDYSTTMDKDTECEFHCHCGGHPCRKGIKGFATLPKRLKAQYTKLGVVQKFLLTEK